MKTQIFSLCIIACTACAFDIDDALDQLDSTLTISGFQDNFRARLSGTVDLEFYNFQQPAPGLINSNIDNLFNYRLTLFLDAQVGSQVYFFAQARLDRARVGRARTSRAAASGLKRAGGASLRRATAKIVEEIGLDDGVTALTQLGLMAPCQ